MRHTLGGAALHDVHPCAADDVPAVYLNDKAPPHGFCRPCGGVALKRVSLRHTNASLLIAQGVDVRTVASLLGHAQASTTLDIYAHAVDKNKCKAQEKLGKAIGL